MLTVSISLSVDEFEGFTQGLSFGLKTSGQVFTQCPECRHLSAFHTMVISPFV